jgi:hypothetical protein
MIRYASKFERAQKFVAAKTYLLACNPDIKDKNKRAMPNDLKRTEGKGIVKEKNTKNRIA